MLACAIELDVRQNITMETTIPESFERLSLIGSASTVIQLGQAQLYPILLKSSESISWQSGDAMTEIGSFASGVARIATGCFGSETNDSKSDGDNSILITVNGGDQTGYRVIINSVSDSSSEVTLEMYYEGYNMPMPEGWRARRYCQKRVEQWADDYCPKRLEDARARIQSERVKARLCCMCGKPLSFFARLAGKRTHAACLHFRE
jgi:hypothetical protein